MAQITQVRLKRLKVDAGVGDHMHGTQLPRRRIFRRRDTDEKFKVRYACVNWGSI
jgi:hypothetical protein